MRKSALPHSWGSAVPRVREAVLRLAREGLLVVMPRRGTVISNISMENIRQLYEARVMLEPQILRIAAKRADKIHWPAGKPFLKLRPRRRCGGYTAAVPQ